MRQGQCIPSRPKKNYETIRTTASSQSSSATPEASEDDSVDTMTESDAVDDCKSVADEISRSKMRHAKLMTQVSIQAKPNGYKVVRKAQGKRKAEELGFVSIWGACLQNSKAQCKISDHHCRMAVATSKLAAQKDIVAWFVEGPSLRGDRHEASMQRLRR